MVYTNGFDYVASIPLLVPIIASFLVTLLLIPKWIKRAKRAGLVWGDYNKPKKTEVAGAGGINVIAGFILGILIYIALKTFFYKTEANVIEIFALMSVILIASLVGLIDDLLGWKIGLSKKLRVILMFFAAIPLVVISAGEAYATLPFFGRIYLGAIYYLIVIPVGIGGAATTFNFLAGFNGLEARQGMLILGALAVATWFTGNSWLTLIALCMFASLFAFILFNNYPARVFPGDVMTYSIGALIAVIAILGNLEKLAIFIFIPNIIEVFLKVRGKLKIQSFGKPMQDGSLELKQKGIYGLTHLSIKILKKFKHKVYENDVVNLINAFQIAVIIIAFIIFRNGIFG